MKDKTLLNVLAIKTPEKAGSLRCKARFNIVFKTRLCQTPLFNQVSDIILARDSDIRFAMFSPQAFYQTFAL